VEPYPSDSSKKFLIVQTASAGDVILSTPLLEKLHALYPEARIDVLVKKGNESLFRKHPFITRLYVWDKSQKKYKNLLSILKEIRKNRYELVINIQRFASTGLLTLFSRARETSGFKKNPCSLLFTHRIGHDLTSGRHEIERNLDLIAYIKDTREFLPRLYPSQEDYDNIAPYTRQKYFCVAPASLWFTKAYPENKWADIIDQIDEQAYIYLLGSHADAELCNSIAGLTRHPHVVNLAGKLSFLETAALTGKAVMTFSNDSAAQHLASAMNAPVTTIFCSTIPQFGFGPLSENAFIIETRENLSCKPCGLHGLKKCPEGHFKCATTIETEQLLTRL